MSGTGQNNRAWAVGRWALWLIPLIVPLAFSRFELRSGRLIQFTFDPIDLAKLVALEVLVLVAASGWAIGVWTERRIRVDLVDGLFGTLLAAMAISTLLSISPRTSIVGSYARYDGLASMALLYLLFFLTRQLITDARSVSRLGDSVMAGATAVSLYAILQYVGMDPLRWSNVNWGAGRTFSTFGNPDMLGGYLIFGAAIAWAVALGGAAGARRHASWLAAITTTVALVTTFTRGAWLGFLVALAVIAAQRWAKGGGLSRLSKAYLVAAAVLIGLVVLASTSASTPVANTAARISSATSGLDPSVNQRLLLWQSAARATIARPVFGYGPGTFRYVFQTFRPDRFPTSVVARAFPDNAHGFIPQTAATDGLVVLGLALLIVGVLMVRPARRLFGRHAAASNQPGAVHDVLVGVWAGLAGYAVYLLSGIAVMSSLALCILCLAVLPEGLRWRTARLSVAVLVAGAVCALATVLFALGASSTVADVSLQQAVATQDPQAARVYAQRAAAFGPFEPRYESERLLLDEANVRSLWLQDQTARSANSQSGGSAELGVAVAAAGGDFENYLRREPFDTDAAAKLTNLYNLAGSSLDPSYYSQAVRIARPAVDIAPGDPLLHLVLAVAYAGSGESKKSVPEFERVVAIDPSYEPAWSLLGVVRLKTGDVAGARAAFTQALQLDSTDSQAITALRGLGTPKTK